MNSLTQGAYSWRPRKVVAVVAIRANIETEQAGETRRQPRRTLRLVTDTVSAGVGNSAIIYNLSPGGMLVDCQLELGAGDFITLRLPEAGTVTAKVVWRYGSIAGCEFLQPISQAAMSACILRAEPEIPGPHLYQKGISEAFEYLNRPQPVRDLETFLILGGLIFAASLCLAGIVAALT